ncbi:carboxypeptidase-like regulatory domain-containing protein [Pedobacter nyackensis]|uniref:Cna protein B-type domain-containing protein n=1 Tax=Pedobacter nyackensis TaxID=475255 RepID=A0A1W2DB35_9SPHI|nr:carboxypeptidase-like regulatory domain-containing protein [Pedobacter nyackensis]SMC94719.1 hypothetical protein SAMN04488101_106124 [Pedobacter nyackensis]
MKCKTILLLGLSVLTVSCKKITNVEVVDGVNTGKLSYKLNDDSGKGLAGVKVSVYDTETNFSTSSPNPNALVGTVLTDHEGVAYFSDLLPKNYLVTTDSPTVNKVKYRTDEFVQIVADIEKKKVIKVSEFSGLLNIRLISNIDYRTPLKNLGVAAHPVSGVRLNSDNVADVAKASTLKGVTDENGFVSIKVPSNITFDFIVYHLIHRNLGWGHGNYRVGKEEKNIITLYTYPF